MSYFDEYKRRVQKMAGRTDEEINTKGEMTLREAIVRRSTDAQKKAFYESPTLEFVKYDGVEDTPVIQSDRYKDIELQTFLFEPEFPIGIGTLIESKGYTFLAVSKNMNEIYPVLIARLCNDYFEVPIGFDEKVVTDRLGNKRTVRTAREETVPVVISDKDYSVSGNVTLPLPSGRINIEMPYKDEYLEHFKVNFKFTHNAGTYRVTDVRESRITPTEKFIKVSATVIQSDEVVDYDE